MKGAALIALVIAWYFGAKALKQPRPGVIAAIIVWLLYALFESLIVAEVLCDAKCNIRVDIFLIWPLLLIVSLFGRYAPGEWTGTGKVLRVTGIVFFTLIVAAFAYMVLVETPASERANQALPPSTGGATGTR